MPRQAVRVRLGLCCLFVDEPTVRFRTTTVRILSALSKAEARQKLMNLTFHNAVALRNAIIACQRLGITAFRITSGLLPLATHPAFRYGVAELPRDTADLYHEAGRLAHGTGIRLSFHPDQFVLLGSPNPATTASSVAELRVHGDLADLIGVDVINLHAGGGYGDKPAALDRVARNLELLPEAVRKRLTLENDDRVFHVRDLLPLCRREGVPLVYDVHHHRCHPDGLPISTATRLCRETWDREPLFHISSPRDGWTAPKPRRHADLIDPADFPKGWLTLPLTVDVEAKAKEKAVLDLREKLGLEGWKTENGEPKTENGE